MIIYPRRITGFTSHDRFENKIYQEEEKNSEKSEEKGGKKGKKGWNMSSHPKSIRPNKSPSDYATKRHVYTYIEQHWRNQGEPSLRDGIVVRVIASGDLEEL